MTQLLENGVMTPGKVVITLILSPRPRLSLCPGEAEAGQRTRGRIAGSECVHKYLRGPLECVT